MFLPLLSVSFWASNGFFYIDKIWVVYSHIFEIIPQFFLCCVHNSWIILPFVNAKCIYITHTHTHTHTCILYNGILITRISLFTWVLYWNLWKFYNSSKSFLWCHICFILNVQVNKFKLVILFQVFNVWFLIFNLFGLYLFKDPGNCESLWSRYLFSYYVKSI